VEASEKEASQNSKSKFLNPKQYRILKTQNYVNNFGKFDIVVLNLPSTQAQAMV